MGNNEIDKLKERWKDVIVWSSFWEELKSSMELAEGGMAIANSTIDDLSAQIKQANAILAAFVSIYTCETTDRAKRYFRDFYGGTGRNK
jgi:hypothetical protein